MEKRITYIDTAKGILILLMLIGHIWNEGFVHDFIYVFHMPAFFMISGMVSSKKELSFYTGKKYFFSRVKTLLIPYLFFELYAIFADIICNGAYLNVKGYLYQIITLRLFNGPLWFLAVMFISSIIFYFLQGLESEKARSAVILCLLAAAMVMPQYRAYISLSTVSLALLYMVVGCYHAKRFAGMSSARDLALTLCVTILISFTDIGEMPDYQSGNRLLFLFGSVCGTMLVLLTGKRMDHPFFQFFGQNSLVILGSHYPIIRLVKHFFQFEEFSAFGGILFFIVLVPLQVLIILLINRFCPIVAGKTKSEKTNYRKREK